jgi:hypothetical protein
MNARLVFLTTMLLAVALLAAAPTRGVADEEEGNFAQAMLKGLTLGQPVVTDQLFVFPLLAASVPETLGVESEPSVDTVDFEEPDFMRRRYDVLVKNGGDKPVLVLGGTVLEGGKRDRLIRRSVLVAPKSNLEAAALPASASSDIRKEAEPFGVAESLAPTYLRKKALFGGSALTVTSFIARALDFREEDDDRKSIVAIAESPKLKQFCLPCHESMSNLPQPKAEMGRVVGAIGGVRGRIQGLVLFGNNELFIAYFERFLKGATWPAAVIELQAKKAGVPLPGKDDPEVTLEILTKEAQALLDNLSKARFKKDRMEEGEAGEAFLFRTSSGTRGRALGLDGRLVYFAAFPHDPFESALYRGTITVPDEELAEDPTRPGAAELERKAGMEGRRLTEYEKRLLERLQRPPVREAGPSGPGVLPGRRPGPSAPGLPPRR